MLKRNETTGIRTYQPNYQPYGDVYGTSGQYGAGGYWKIVEYLNKAIWGFPSYWDFLANAR